MHLRKTTFFQSLDKIVFWVKKFHHFSINPYFTRKIEIFKDRMSLFCRKFNSEQILYSLQQGSYEEITKKWSVFQLLLVYKTTFWNFFPGTYEYARSRTKICKKEPTSTFFKQILRNISSGNATVHGLLPLTIHICINATSFHT